MIWKKLVLQKACSLITRGITPKYLESGGVRVLNQKCIRNHAIDFSLARRHDISKKSVKQERFIQKGDVLINSTGQGTLGRVAQVRENPSEPTTVDSHITIVRPNAEFFYLEFFGYAAIFIEEKIKAAGQGVGGQTELSKTKLKEEFYVSFPSDLGQQQRIVAKLDDLFAEINEAIEIARNKQKNAEQLFTNYLANIFQIKNQKWESDKLQNITSKIGSGATPRGGKASYKTEGISLIRSMNVHDMYFKYKDLAKIDDEQAAALSNVAVQENDVLFNITGASVARCCLVAKDVIPARVNQHVSIIRVDTSKVLPKFIVFGLISKTYKDQLLSVGKSGGSTRQAITKTQIQDFVFHYPKSKEEQNTIINKLDSIHSHVKNLEEICIKLMNQNIQLKSAILSEELMPNKEFAA